MSKAIPNLKTRLITRGEFVCSGGDNERFPYNITCLQNGVVEIYPLKGDKFVWNASYNKTMNVVIKKIVVISGVFMIKFAFYKTPSKQEEYSEYFNLIDELNDNIIDENNDYFIIK